MEKQAVNIYVEGKADVKFIFDYLRALFANSTFSSPKNKGQSVEIDGIVNSHKVVLKSIDGWMSLKNIKNELQTKYDNNETSLIVCDADFATDNPEDFGGFLVRKAQIESWLANVPHELFLFPNNHDNGALEDLLENIILDRNQPIFDRWNNYVDSLTDIEIENHGKLTQPEKKTKIYVYTEVLLGESHDDKSHIAPATRDYNSKEHWNLDSEYLKALKEFLCKYFD